jgi:hypothetical protein
LLLNKMASSSNHDVGFKAFCNLLKITHTIIL